MMIDDVIQQFQDSVRRRVIAPNQKLEDALKQAYVIKVQNVADYLYESSPKDRWDFEKDFPDVAPPLPYIWFEWRMPRVLNVEGKVLDNPGWGSSQGVLMRGVDMRTVPNANLKNGIRWLCNANFFVKSKSESWIRCTGGLGWFVKDDGQIHLPDRKWLAMTLEQDEAKSGLLADFMSVTLYVPMLTLSFMHCKNVETVPGPAWDPKIQKARVQRGRLPLVRWHTVVIDPVKKAVAAANGGNPQLTPRALHICRGHWKTFEEKGLFGKYFGRYWWTDQKRGSPEHGIVVKDYLVKSPKSDHQLEDGKPAC